MRKINAFVLLVGLLFSCEPTELDTNFKIPGEGLVVNSIFTVDSFFSFQIYKVMGINDIEPIPEKSLIVKLFENNLLIDEIKYSDNLNKYLSDIVKPTYDNHYSFEIRGFEINNSRFTTILA